MTPLFLGIDLGTSGAKAVLISDSGQLLASAGQEYPIRTSRPGWAEEDPQDWLAAVSACVRSVVAQVEDAAGQIAGIGLTGQMHSLVCVDAKGEPVRPAILWADQRSGEQVQQLTQAIPQEQWGAWIGNPLAAGFMLVSWRWLQQYEPESVRRTRWLMLPKDYLRYRMTGKIGSEPSDASSTGLFDPHTQSWCEALLEWIGLPKDHLPPVFPSQEVAGTLLPDIAAGWGLPAGLPVVFGGSDVSCQALAQGIVLPGRISCTIGTGGQIFAPLTAPTHDPRLRIHLFCHCLPKTWHQEAAILTAGLALRWLRDNVFSGTDYAALANTAAQVESGLDDLFFFPYLAGERTPYMNPRLRASFQGLTLRHGQAHMVRAVMEGVVFGLRQGLDLMLSLGTPVERVYASGGSIRHPLWLQLQADIFNRPIYISEMGEATARGAATLAAVGTGLYADAAAAWAAFDHFSSEKRVETPAAQPEPQRAARYQAAYQRYCELAGQVSRFY
jgi:xylulokinase